ncbi:TetR/AcrR family transcriptional regulator [Spongiibacter sp. KMU-158]|uniref:TetR/AcrR family transcriptional regulator n=1 Tax=Spongiibacter pelagi TaxID=2760804 RepID=A0A927GVG3_9GAMM|nr:TetR/AcrR family transcriptional regulator [Spongiibacter pelagi]MBD2857852.1 TetR/AcrR family transcriptional regulator [Spongiibacter pelagi]
MMNKINQPLAFSDNFNDTQLRILDAAITCVKDWGLEKTSLNDIAKRAGVTRPTVYNYFSNKNEVIRTALLQSGYALAERMVAHISAFPSPAEKLIEAMVYAVNTLPTEPHLDIVTHTEIPSDIYEDALQDTEGQQILLMIFGEILKDEPDIDANDLMEIIEISVRLALSLTTLKGTLTRSDEELRAFLSRRLLPAVGL